MSRGPSPEGARAPSAEVPDPTTADAWCREVVEGSPDGLVLIDGSGGGIRYVNRAFEVISGWAHDDLLGRPPEVLLPVGRRADHADLRRGYEGTPTPRAMGQRRDLVLQRADGGILPVDIALAPVAVDGRTMTVATVRDVSTRRAAEVERSRLADILDLVPDAIIVVDLSSGRIVDLNRAAPLLLGHPAAELQGMPVARLAPGDEPVLLTDGYSPHGQRLVTRDGRVLDCEVHATTVGPPESPRLVNVVRDVHERLELERRLRANEESFRTAFEQAPVGIAVTTRDARGARTILQANSAFTTIFGYDPTELDGHDPAVLRPGEPAPPRPVDDLVDRTVVRPYVRKDGSEIWAEVRATRLDREPERDPRFLVHAIDVTPRVRAEQVSRRHTLVTECVADVARAALERRPEDEVCERIARGAADATGAAAVMVLRADGNGGGWWPVVAVGPLAGAVRAGLGTPGGAVLADDLLGAGPSSQGSGRGLHPELGPAAAARFGVDPASAGGGIMAFRRHGDPPFLAEDLEQLARLGAQTQMALHLSRARADQERLLLLEERQRIARELHDTVIQDVIAIGMEISAEADREGDPARRAHDLGRIARLEEVTRTLRRAVLQLRSDARRGSLARQVADVVAEAERVLGHTPVVTLSGSLDRLGPDLAGDLLGTLREALSNIARHARADDSAVTVRVTEDEVVLTVDDDGVGTAAAAPAGYGLRSMAERAQRHRGSFSVGPGGEARTRVEWRAPLRQEPPG